MAIMQNFKHPQLGEIRVLEIDGAPWFVGKDVAAALGYVDTDQALRKRVDEEYKQTRQIDGTNQNHNMIVINEDGLLNLIFSCRRPCAKVFNKWVMNDIMPALHLKKENNIASKNDVVDCENAEINAETGEKISLFSNPEFGEIRGIEINGEPWLVGKDVAAALGYAKPLNAIATHINKDDSLKQGLIDGIGRMQETIFINESGVFSLIFSSKLPEAQKFTHWVTSEVLPSIRKTGMYIPNPATSRYDISELSPSLQMANALSKTLNTLLGNIDALFDSMAQAEMEQKRQAEEQARQAAEQERIVQEQERQAAEQKRQAQEQEQHTEALKTVDRKLEDIRDIVVVHLETWRKDCHRLVAAIAQKRGGANAYRDTNAEIFKLLEDRAHVSLQTRLRNRRNRMAEKGIAKSKRDKLNQMDIIEEDAKLTEIYIGIVKEMCVQYEVSPSVLEEAQSA